MSLEENVKEAKNAFNILQTLSVEDRDDALDKIVEELRIKKSEVLAANAEDMKAAKLLAESGKLSSSMVKRLDLSSSDKYDSMVQGVLDVKSLPDPLGRVTYARSLDDGLDLYKVSCPVGLLLVIFEARPEVIINITSLAIKSGNAVVLKGGTESAKSFAALSNVVRSALGKSKVPQAAVQLVQSREEVSQLLKLDEYIDLVIPRGSTNLVRHIKDNTKIPVLGHAAGLCSMYVHEDADMELASKLVLDGKTDYPAACNAIETLLINEAVLSSHLPKIAETLTEAKVTLKCDPASLKVLKDMPKVSALVEPSVDQDYNTEFSDLILAIKTVPSLQSAMQHINTHGSKHTDCIITSSEAAANRFMAGIDASGVYWNASTRFADGFRYGYGTEVGISTNKIHARGPMGLDGLTIYKYQLRGNGQVASSYGVGPGKRAFKHTPINIDNISQVSKK
ncbi:gamma-glutamyl phosphate reductase Pro1 [Schizosaccharomyces pombe]|uniref:Probable gamma-glutamyl phosphate reductase n=1 Tax=Schizosaccharomyces pombe (strain 972 / ATCC 24843) TaxID=284812 RepID=PROA_SCHPO|nr:putative gamma-glutamyl phosphate reductase Pro1 [Schizosaccharomyces pombe]Q9UT44.1 RecName: Full=Probable gamma-glutamyl phosphate reductase; Short=GPR; AltName: Full=Glutamate-5-semialdehyde dehydrogenase; Short=GSA dehydrogenase; AltName: Full=Glutamyl-gamma-semialdehyde dehydrogenase [Schizosaccharomyces pombe 972h-]CAB57445.1 gamma-glutamyl phosphate reductase Pro1 (predicted) [Schizosaccharomyces pombe]|eukprot:NP_593164.1 putative gamma-glutamyl phosphate reductase Pro1 [Schizosaccharomyces pombe]